MAAPTVPVRVYTLPTVYEETEYKKDGVFLLASFETGWPSCSSLESQFLHDVDLSLIDYSTKQDQRSRPTAIDRFRRTISSIRSRLRQFYDYIRLVVFTTYRQLWLLIVGANLAAILTVIIRESHAETLPLAACTNAAVANITVAILIRQDYVKNLCYHVCWSCPHSAPLWVRKKLAMVYEFGGVHSGAAVGALLWFALFTAYLWTTFAASGYSDAVVLTFDIVLLVLLFAIASSAVPQMRRLHHNVFEKIHRWAGWFGIALLWIALILFTRDQANSSNEISFGMSLIKLPAFWMLLITSGHIIYPWLSLRKVAVVRYDRLSDRAIRLYFSPKEKIVPLHGLAISDAPLHEWHSFAAISDFDGSEGGSTSTIISKAGDWTSKTIAQPQPYYYMRGQHVTGVLAMARLFRRVVVMATGSGIGPVMALFGGIPRTSMRIIWSTPSPRATFGDRICDAVLDQDPQAVIWDTRKPGQKRPDLAQMAYDMYHEIDAEALFFISNRDLTRKIVAELRVRGVNTFAPVFDS